ncbi:uncharacterized protein L203_104663 [Cryptococcus depauperatus CBS 7841]|uniref:Sister chromatid cohesion protein PDS5 n=1 Tax=Cryptococcus depauperatus CBS 7841 TaxID=1295531 RepID=A0AAJ8M1T6_9TREE
MAPAPPLARLDFHEPLLQQGKRETTEALLKRLKTLKQKLSTLEQDLTDTKTLDPVKKPLIHQTILHHKDRGVKANAACCLADLLRLYAPDAPYSDAQLRDIFQFFLTQITQNLRPSTPQSRQQGKSKIVDSSQTTSSLSQRITDIPYYTEYYTLIESLATIKSIVLICDVPGSDELIVSYFEGFMEVARSDMSKTLMRYMRDVLVSIIEEATSLPSRVMDCLVDQFENYAKKPETPSFQLTIDVCNEVADKLKRPFFAHFSEIQLSHGRDPSHNDLRILSKSHDLLLTINRFCPGTLLNTIPLLEENLKAVDEIPLRQLSTRTLGHVFAERAGAEDPAKKYPGAWRGWMSRQKDKALPVRLAWVETVKGVLMAPSDVRAELEEAMAERLADPDDKIRAAMCKLIGSLDYETALHHLRLSTLRAAAERLLDKKSLVRTEAAMAIAKLWQSAYSEIEAGEAEAIRQFAWIPQTMIAALFISESTADFRPPIIAAIKSSILPLPQDIEDEQAWVDRLLLVTSYLDEDGRQGLGRLTGLIGYSQGNSPYMAFTRLLEEYAGGNTEKADQVKSNLNMCILAIARSIYEDPGKGKKDLQQFADINEPRLYKLYRTCVDPVSGLAAIVKARNEFLRRVHQSHEDLLPTLKTLLDSSSWNIVNHSSIHPLIKRIQKPDSETSASAAAFFLSLIAKECPPMLKSHIQELVAAAADRKNERLIEMGFQALASVCKIYPELTPEDKTSERANFIALEGTPRQAKFAVRFLARSRDAETSCLRLIDNLLESVCDDKKENKKQITYLTAFSELAKSAPKAFSQRSKEVIKYVMDKVLLAPSTSNNIDGDEWMLRELLEPIDHAKVIGLRVCTHWSLAFARDPDAEQLINPTISLLTAVLINDGAVNEVTGEGGPARCHMRLRASLCLLKLARVKTFDKFVSQPVNFEIIAGTIQDPCYMVRHLWIKKLGRIIGSQSLLPRWNMLPALAAMDPDMDNIIDAKRILTSIPKMCTRLNLPRESRIERTEMPFARLLHFLTHHPDFVWHEPEEDKEGKEGITSAQNLKDISKFIELYLDCLAHKDNIGLLYHIAGQLKTVRDRFTNNSKPLYALSELAQIIIRNRAERHAWAVPIYPGKIGLPKDIFHHQESSEEKTRVQKTQYLDEETRSWARNLGKKGVVTPSNVRRVATEKSSPRKRVRLTETKPRKKRLQSVTSNEDSGESDSDGDTVTGNSSEAERDLEDGEAVLGRGGRRGAKIKANRAVGKKGRKERVEKRRQEEKMIVDEDDDEDD